MNELRTYIVEEIIEKLKEYEGVKAYACDLAYTLFEGENADCTYTYSTKGAIDWIQEHFEDLGEIVEELKFSIGADYVPNVFDKPEQFQVVIIMEGASHLLGRCKTIDENWNDEIELTEELTNKIIEELEEIKNNNSYDFYV